MQTREKLVNLCKGLVKDIGWNDRVLALACKQLGLSTVILARQVAENCYQMELWRLQKLL